MSAAERPAPHPFDYVTSDQIQDLWGIGYTIVRRSRHVDPFNVPPEMVPQGRSYQWWRLVQDKFHFERTSSKVSEADSGTGWAPVPASRHDGYFMPFGHVGPIEVGGLGLFEKSKFEVDQEKAEQIAAAHKQTTDWIRKTGIDGISGSVSVGGVGMEVGEGEKVFKNTTAKTIETMIRVPKDMIPHMKAVFDERDELYTSLLRMWDADILSDWQREICDKYQEALVEDPSVPKGPTLNALLMPHAVENVRAKLKEGKTDE
jgi:hypothetical protein